MSNTTTVAAVVVTAGSSPVLHIAPAFLSTGVFGTATPRFVPLATLCERGSTHQPMTLTRRVRQFPNCETCVRLASQREDDLKVVID